MTCFPTKASSRIWTFEQLTVAAGTTGPQLVDGNDAGENQERLHARLGL
jgi:hypothetical protein